MRKSFVAWILNLESDFSGLYLFGAEASPEDLSQTSGEREPGPSLEVIPLPRGFYPTASGAPRSRTTGLVDSNMTLFAVFSK